mgnify:CR=1 FL=1
MKLSRPPNLMLTRRPGGRGAAHQTMRQRLKVEAPIESAREGAQLVGGVFAEVEGLVRGTDHRLEVAQHGFDPGELQQIARFARTHDGIGVSTTCIDDTGKASRARTPTAEVGVVELDVAPQRLRAVVLGDGGHPASSRCHRWPTAAKAVHRRSRAASLSCSP